MKASTITAATIALALALPAAGHGGDNQCHPGPNGKQHCHGKKEPAGAIWKAGGVVVLIGIAIYAVSHARKGHGGTAFLPGREESPSRLGFGLGADESGDPEGRVYWRLSF